jgi:hypothetical protein
MIASSKSPIVIALCVIGAALLVASGLIHLHLWRGPQGYRHVTTGHMNVLFMIQIISCFVAAAALLALRNALVALGAAALMAGTFIGFLLARYRSAGLFGFKIGFSSGSAKSALTIEIAATVLLLLTAALMARGQRSRTAAP